MNDTNPPVSLTLTDDGRFHLTGELSFQTVPNFYSANRDLFKRADRDLHIDLDGVSRADSAGIALLIEWQRQAQQQSRTISFYNIPSQLLAIARLSGVETILNLSS